MTQLRCPMGRCCNGGENGKKHSETCRFEENGTRKKVANLPSEGTGPTK